MLKNSGSIMDGPFLFSVHKRIENMLTKEEIAELLGAEIVHDFHGDFIGGVLFGINWIRESHKSNRRTEMQKEYEVCSLGRYEGAFDTLQEAIGVAETHAKNNPAKLVEIFEKVATVENNGSVAFPNITWGSKFPIQVIPGGVIHHTEQSPVEQCINLLKPRKMVVLEGEHKGEVVDFLGFGIDYEELPDGIAHFSCVLVEFDNGVIGKYLLYEVQFVKESANVG